MAWSYPRPTPIVPSVGRPRPGVAEAPAPWTWRSVVGFVLVAAGMALYLGFGSEEADLVHAGDPVSTGIRIGVISGAVAFVAGVVALAWDGVRRGRAEGRIARRVAGALGLGLVAVLAGFLALLIVVQIAFA